jgi:trk system potassium uptake protein TrkA
MKIVILGAGQVGSALAEHLSTEQNDVTVVDNNVERLRELQERLDIRTIYGQASHPSVLLAAGAKNADLLIAVTHSDECNMTACQVAHGLFGTPNKIARIRAQQYLTYPELIGDKGFHIDTVISPESLVMQFIRNLILQPDTLQVLNFADGRVQLVAVKASSESTFVNHTLKEIRDILPDIDTKIVAIYRRDTAILPNETTLIEADDEIFFLAQAKHVHPILRELRHLEKAYKRIIIAGGGNIGFQLASSLENQFQVKIIDASKERCQFLSRELEHTLILTGDAADKELLLDENIANTDLFCALTDKDEANIMSAILAKRLGAYKVLALINREAYADLVQGGEIDMAISPQQATISKLLSHVRKGDMVDVHTLRRGAAEAIEAIAHGDKKTSQVVGRTVNEIRLPPGTIWGAIVRGEEVIINSDTCVIEPEDHIILFIIDKRHIPEVERLFQVGITFV